MTKVPVYKTVETFKTHSDTSYGILEKFDVVLNSITGKNFIVIHLTNKDNGTIKEYTILYSDLIKDFKVDVSSFELETKFNFETQTYYRAEVLKWWDGKNENSISTESGEQPYQVKRIFDYEVFTVGDSIKYPNIHLVDTYPILSFRIEKASWENINEVLINSHKSLGGMRSITAWELNMEPYKELTKEEIKNSPANQWKKQAKKIAKKEEKARQKLINKDLLV